MNIKVICKYILSTLLGIIFSLPVVTLADSITAMHFVNFRLVKEPDTNVCREFFKSFKLNFLQSLWFLLIIGGVGTLFGYLWVATLKDTDNFNIMLTGLLLIATLLFFNFEFLSTYLLSKFTNTTVKLIMLSVYASIRNVDKVTKASFLETAMIAVPVFVYCVNPCVVSLSVAIAVFFVLMVVFEIVSAKIVTPIFEDLIKQNGKANES